MIFTTDMSYANHILEPDPIQQAEDAQLYRYVLHKLLHLGTDLIHILQAQATAHAHAAMQAPTPPKPSTDQAIAFDRIARTIRRTITLARSLNEPAAPAKEPARPHHAAARTPTPPEAGRDAASHPAATPGRDDAANADAPSASLRDRPEAPDRDAPDRDAPDRDAPDRDPPDRDGPDRDEDDTGRPPAEIIADICRDLGLDAPPNAHPWTRDTPADRTPADIDLLCTLTAAPSSAAASGPCHPGPGPQEPWPQGPGHGAAQPPPGPGPGNREPGGPTEPTAIPRAQPAPVHPGCTPPDDPPEAAAMIPSHAARADARWRRPPEG